MNIKNCRKCGKIFNYISGPAICPACLEKQEEQFQQVKEYINSNPGVTLHQTAEACEVDAGQIKQWVREERLVFSSAEGSGLVCENCGKPIITGRFCDSCRTEMGKKLGESIQKPAAPQPKKKDDGKSSPKMRFLR